MWIELLLVLILGVYVINKWFHSYWKRKGVYQIEPMFLFGNTKDLFLNRTISQKFFSEIYKNHKNRKLIGIYGFYKPLLLVTCPELMKQVTVKDFNSFAGAGADISVKDDPMMGINPFVTMDVETWKERRGLHVATLSPGKLKLIPELLVTVGRYMLKYIDDHGGKPVKVKQLSDYFALDALCSSRLGYEPTVFKDPKNPFMEHASDYKLFESNFSTAFNASLFYPFVTKFIPYRMVSKESQDFFVSLSRNMMEHRKQTSGSKVDFIDHVIKTNEKLIQEGKPGFTDLEVAGHCVTVYMDSFITTAGAMGFLILDLCRHPKIQDSIREEIRSVGKRFEDFDYDKIHSIQTLEAALKESLRLHPPVALSARTCLKDAELGGIKVEKGTRVLLPFPLFHTDPDYYPEPEEFRPERFSDPDSIIKGTYMPFGDGPRMCLGSKYAQLIIKIGIIYLLLNYKICLPGIQNEKKGEEPVYILSNINLPGENDTVIFQKLQV